MNNTMAPGKCPRCGSPIPPEALQGVCPKCLLRVVATPTELEQPAENRPPPPVEVVQAALPHLEVLELIGCGGMGAVYRARQPKLDRTVALKVLLPPRASESAFAERFSREARVLARLNHPGVVSVFDYGEAGGFYYLVMEYVDGVNLRQAMQAGGFTPVQALTLVPKICEALQYAHNEGILHRDIKPENILLDSRGRVKIADFGIAKLIGDKVRDVALTASGAALGTPHYMAPEQLEHPKDVDERADIYSLGVVFYEMLTGELPIGRFAPPSEKSTVDPRVDEVVLRALEKERERRQRNATEIKQQVEAIASTPPAPAQPAAGDEACPLSSVAPRTARCFISTPEHLRTFRARVFGNFVQGKGELRLDRATLTFCSGWQAVSMPLSSIRALATGSYPPAEAGPEVPMSYIGVTFEEHGVARTLLFTPLPDMLMSAWERNARVAEWVSALQEAIHAATGGAVSVASLKGTPRRSWPWAAVSFLMTVVGITVGARLTGDFQWWSAIVSGLVGAALAFVMLYRRDTRRGQWFGLTGPTKPSPLPRPLKAWERRWLAQTRSTRRRVRTRLQLGSLLLVLAWLAGTLLYWTTSWWGGVIRSWAGLLIMSVFVIVESVAFWVSRRLERLETVAEDHPSDKAAKANTTDPASASTIVASGRASDSRPTDS